MISNAFSAEFGWTAGPALNIVTKSGTNQVHGSLYGFFRNDAMDAISILAAPGFHTLHQNQFGAAIGGFLGKSYRRFPHAPPYHEPEPSPLPALGAIITV